MNTISKSEIIEANKILHKVLGFDSTELEFYKEPFEGEKFLYKKIGNNCIEPFEKSETLGLIENCSNDVRSSICRSLSFYYPRWIAFNVIKESDDKYAEFSSNNELILALTSIIDRIANLDEKKFGYTRRFVNFLEKSLLDKEDIKKLIKAKVYKECERKNIKSVNDLAKYVYDIRSMVVHRAELEGIYPYNVSFDLNLDEKKNR